MSMLSRNVSTMTVPDGRAHWTECRRGPRLSILPRRLDEPAQVRSPSFYVLHRSLDRRSMWLVTRRFMPRLQSQGRRLGLIARPALARQLGDARRGPSLRW